MENDNFDCSILFLQLQHCPTHNKCVAMMDPISILAAVTLLLVGATMKGLLGLGLPMIAIPGLTLLFGLPQALAMVSIPVAAANMWQVWQFRRAGGVFRILLPFIVAGGFGTVIGTLILASVAEVWLEITLAVMLIGYIALRLFNPTFLVDPDRAVRFAIPTGVGAGLLHGATGISGPIAITFFHAQRVGRDGFILATGSVFLGFTLVQIPVLSAVGILDVGSISVGIAGLPSVALGLWLGNRLARYVDAALFDQLVLAVLGWTALALLWHAWSG